MPKRVQIGLLDNGKWGIRVTKPGIDMAAAGPGDFVLDSETDLMKTKHGPLDNQYVFAAAPLTLEAFEVRHSYTLLNPLDSTDWVVNWDSATQAFYLMVFIYNPNDLGSLQKVNLTPYMKSARMLCVSSRFYNSGLPYLSHALITRAGGVTAPYDTQAGPQSGRVSASTVDAAKGITSLTFDALRSGASGLQLCRIQSGIVNFAPPTLAKLGRYHVFTQPVSV